MNVKPRVRHAFHVCALDDVTRPIRAHNFLKRLVILIYHTADSR